MNRHDTIELIVNHAIEQGRYSGLYMETVCAMTDAELDRELERLEADAVDAAFDMPSYDAFGVNQLNSFNTPSN